jgi:protein-S-isoprenylcysteine O-methyltransferase Ste14
MSADPAGGSHGAVTGDDEPDHADVPLPPPLIYVAALLAGRLLERPLPAPAPPAQLTTPLVRLGPPLGVALAVTGAGVFRRAGTEVVPFRPSTALVTNGPYRFTRNPMYVGMGLVHAGIAARWKSTWSLLMLVPALVAVDRLIIAREERYLERKFGEEYRRYKRQVRRWL